VYSRIFQSCFWFYVSLSGNFIFVCIVSVKSLFFKVGLCFYKRIIPFFKKFSFPGLRAVGQDSFDEPVKSKEFLKMQALRVKFWIILCLSVCLSLCQSAWNNSAPIRWIFMKLIISAFFEICTECSRFIKLGQD